MLLTFSNQVFTQLQIVGVLCKTLHIHYSSHFIDRDWVLHKGIVISRVISNHKGKQIDKRVEECLPDWGIDKLCRSTGDNTGSKGLAVQFLRNKISIRYGSILDRKYIHMRFVYVELIVRMYINFIYFLDINSASFYIVMIQFLFLQWFGFLLYSFGLVSFCIGLPSFLFF